MFKKFYTHAGNHIFVQEMLQDWASFGENRTAVNSHNEDLSRGKTSCFFSSLTLYNLPDQVNRTELKIYMKMT